MTARSPVGCFFEAAIHDKGFEGEYVEDDEEEKMRKKKRMRMRRRRRKKRRIKTGMKQW